MSPVDISWDRADLDQLLRELTVIRKELTEAEARAGKLLEEIHPSQLKSARNLVHYLAFRCKDLRPLQTKLTALGLSSLGRCEAHVMATLDAVLRILHELTGKPWPPTWEPGPVGFSEGRTALKKRTIELLGPKGSDRSASWPPCRARPPRTLRWCDSFCRQA